jgi:hypothetical protein
LVNSKVQLVAAKENSTLAISNVLAEARFEIPFLQLRLQEMPSSVPLPRLGAGSLPISENSLGYGAKLANHEPAWLTMTTTVARLMLSSPLTAEKLERYQT